MHTQSNLSHINTDPGTGPSKSMQQNLGRELLAWGLLPTGPQQSNQEFSGVIKGSGIAAIPRRRVERQKARDFTRF